MLEEFRNEAFTDFTRPEAHAAFEAALSRAERAAGEEVPLVVGGRRVTTGRMLENTNPANRSQVVSRHHLADRDLAEAAVGVAV
ncbi:MAG TPA: L-glutamate gamma-semialdehyde dehydrogenase, partial [Thermoanaerobaculia bacterium]|nr:L-glutamate gamma-semialdehyde dehydrogenase [Thermoanaerobaculia bacterium]